MASPLRSKPIWERTRTAFQSSKTTLAFAALNREQDEAFIFALLNHARDIGFTSTNIDLIYGLPKQTPQSFAYTLQKVAELNPDRLSVFNYAHLPTLFAAQRKIKDADLPSAEQKLDILQETIKQDTRLKHQVH